MSIFLIVFISFNFFYAQQVEIIDQLLEGIMTELHTDKILPFDFVHSLERYSFFSAKTNQPHSALENGLRFFTNTAKRIPGFQSSLVVDLIQITRDTVLPYMHPTLRWKYESIAHVENSFELYKQGIQNCLVTGLSAQFDLFKKDPHFVLNQLAIELSAYYQEGLLIESIRKTVINLIDLSLGKIIWSVHDQENNWLSVKKIAALIVGLMNDDIIVNIADIDDLLWTLTERYALFLELVGIGLSDAYYAKVSRELNDKNCIFAFINEQNSCMYSKVDRLKSALNKAYETKQSIQVG